MKTVTGLLTALFLTSSTQADVRERTFQLTYRAVVRDVPKDARAVDIWLPVPQDNHVQKTSNLRVSAPGKYELSRDLEYGNRILHVRVKTPRAASVAVEMKLTVHRQEAVNRPAMEAANRSDGEDDPLLPRFLRPDRLVPVNGRVRELAHEVAGKAMDPMEKARLIYNYVLSHMRYDKSGSGWGRGDIFFACDEKRGNCTDFHALAIGLARAQNIPAKFEIGLPIPPERGEGKISGYHCWAYFFLPRFGWVPIDASEAWKNPDKREYFYGALDENRVAFSIGRDIQLVPAPKGPRVNFFIYPHVEIDGKDHDAVQKELSYRDVVKG